MKLWTAGTRPSSRHRCRAAVAWCLSVLLAGCGAGVVGTGSGKVDDNLPKGPVFESADPCAASFAEAGLDCAAGAEQRVEPGTAPVAWELRGTTDPQTAASARLSGVAIDLVLACAGSTFSGDWVRLEDGTTAFLGFWTAAPGDAGQLALAYVTPAPDQPGAVGWIEVLDTDGARLVGPWLALRAGPDASAPACPA